ncbi:hypothetical protein [Aminobacter ciceronei]|uniref:Lipoprotein n=1 Tax=Aminobacter ciceronei TaxID=150723 RepID=A0ABR6C9L8_9HYPH|nr:hypothetical protein [Aminobacter ciceronei]MBA9021285.1 hypothetical protein [Aminobacter ciceronei]TIW19236.1 MAG: hypothetical protein E5V63_33770 [Mesorhizobium sp.]
MATKPAHIVKALFVVVIAAGVAGCGTVKEKTAPCKRPANLTSYAADPRQECGPMSYVNGDPATAMAAIKAMATQ